MKPDKSLVYSNQNFRDELINFKPTQIRGLLDQVPFVARGDLLTFSQLAYKDSKDLKSEDLPSGWEILTSVLSEGNGYRATAFWSGELQIVAIAHRGTKFNNPGALGADLVGIMYNNYTELMASAVSFVNEVKILLLTINKHPSKMFRLSLTGHSLGAWLAEVTAFTVMFINVEEGKFCRDECGLLAHTVAWDSPGSHDMISFIKKDYGRYDVSMTSDKLDIEGYFIAANMINTCNLHVGRIFIVSKERNSNFRRIWDTITISRFKNVTTHKLDSFVEAFKASGEVRLVLDWPVGVDEKTNLHSQEKKTNTFNPESIEGVRFQTVSFSGESINLAVFSNEELNFLNIWKDYVLNYYNASTSTDIQNYLHNVGWGTIDTFLDVYEINETKRVVTCSNEEEMAKLVRRTKQLFRWFPEEKEKLLHLIKLHIPDLVYRLMDRTYRRQLPILHCNCQDTLGLGDFLSLPYQLFRLKRDDTKLEAARILNILNQTSFYYKDNCTFINWDSLEDLEEEVDINKLLINKDFTRDCLLIVDCCNISRIDSDLLSIIRKALEDCGTNKKVILIFPKYLKDPKLFSNNDKVLLKSCETFTLGDLTPSSQAVVCSRALVSTGGVLTSLIDFIGPTSDTTRMEPLLNTLLYKLVTDKDYVITVDNNLPSLLDFNALCPRLRQEVSEERVDALLGVEKVYILVTGDTVELEGENLRYMKTGGEEEFQRVCLEYPYNVVYWIVSE